jgi:hypothetical protein
MAGLACREGNPVSWQILKNHGASFAPAPRRLAALRLNAESGIPLFSAKGDADPGKHPDIVGEGEYS